MILSQTIESEIPTHILKLDFVRQWEGAILANNGMSSKSLSKHPDAEILEKSKIAKLTNEGRNSNNGSKTYIESHVKWDDRTVNIKTLQFYIDPK